MSAVVTEAEVRAVMQELGKRGGRARAESLEPKRRREIAAQGGRATAGKPRKRKEQRSPKPAPTD